VSIPLTFSGGIPVEVLGPPVTDPSTPDLGHTALGANTELEEKVLTYVLGWKRRLRDERLLKQVVWDECWQLYRGQEDFSNKEAWQSQMVLPKAWSSVKQATNVIKRLLNTSKEPYKIDSVNPDDLVTTIRAEKMTDLTEVFMDAANWIEEFSVSLEGSFIMGVAVMKMWWAMVPKPTLSVQHSMAPHPVTGQMVSQKSVVQSQVNEGRLFIRAVDPYNFYWLPGSKLNRWAGTLEEIEISKWELIDLAHKGVLPLDKVKNIQPRRIQDRTTRDLMRFNELRNVSTGSNSDTGLVSLLEYYGPIVIDDEIIERNAHIIIANETTVLVCQANSLINQQPPYVGFSPLGLPFRTEGIGLIENVRTIDRNLNKLANLSMDTLLFRLMPLFEVNLDVYENPEDFETGFMPGKIFKRNLTNAGVKGIETIEMQDISSGTMQLSGQLDRSHQEGALVTELQQSLPRFSGAQTATETTAIQTNQDSFFGSMAVDIEKGAIEPMVQLAMDLIFQFIDTTTDPRVASILGVDASVLGGIPKADLMEMICGEFKVKVTGLTGQLMKAEALQQLVQFMNLIGQNPQHWLPYINQDALLRRILESFRPAIHDIEDIIADPQTAQAKQQAMELQQQHGALLNLIPHLQQMSHQVSQDKLAEQRLAEQHLMDAAGQAHTQNLALDQNARAADAQAHDQQMTETGNLLSAAQLIAQRENDSRTAALAQEQADQLAAAPKTPK
jgi:hypothetical protein